MYLCGWLTLVRDLTMDVTIQSENIEYIFSSLNYYTHYTTYTYYVIG